MSARRRYLGLALIGALGTQTACVTSRIDTSFNSNVELTDSASVVLLARRQNVEHETESGFMDCVKKAITSGSEALPLGSDTEFMDQLFPWFEPRIAPLSDENLPELLAKPGVAERVLESGIRYVIWVDGSTELIDGGGQLSCDINIGCFGFNWWEKGANYEAAIWDLHDAKSMGLVSTDVSGRSYMPAVVVPIPLIARTQAAACKGMADSLRGYLNQ
ncbi:MAG: hypothetical protein AB8G17_14645 [Gammaproteobacteria bacterium]